MSLASNIAYIMRGDYIPEGHDKPDRGSAVPLNVEGIQASALRLLNAVGDGVLALNSARRVVYSNTAAQELLGLSKENLLGRDMDSLVGTTEPDVLFQAAIGGDVVSTDECELLTEEMGRVPVLLTAVPLAPEALAPGAGDKPGNRENGRKAPRIADFASIDPTHENTRESHNNFGSGVILVFREIGQTSNPAVSTAVSTDRDSEQTPETSASIISNESAVSSSIASSIAPSGIAPSGSDSGTASDARGDTPQARPELEMAISVNNQIKVLLTDLLAETGPDHTIQTALHGVVALTQADFAVIGLYSSGNRMLQFKYSYGFFESIELEVPVLESAAGEMFETREIMAIADYANYERRIPFFVERGVRTYLGAPLFAENSPIGMVALFRETDAPFRDEEVKIIHSLAPVLSAALFKAKYEERLAELATKDSLTGLWNRRVAFENLDREIARFHRYGTPLSVILLDLDYFKMINDSHGHLAGDEVLRAMSRIMSETTRDADLAARTGGEEFMILLPDTRLEGASARAEQLRGDMEKLEVKFQDVRLKCTASIGCAEFHKGETPEEFYARLDGLLYDAKHNGRNRVSI